MESSPGVYLIKLGKVNDLNNVFIFKENDIYDEDFYIFKFGLSIDLKRRFKEHKCHFTKLGCNDIELCHFKIFKLLKNGKYTHSKLISIEKNIKKLFTCENNCSKFGLKDVKEKNYQELVILNIKILDKIKEFYDNLDNHVYIMEYFEKNKINKDIFPKVCKNKEDIVFKNIRQNIELLNINLIKNKEEIIPEKYENKDILFENIIEIDKILNVKIIGIKFDNFTNSGSIDDYILNKIYDKNRKIIGANLNIQDNLFINVFKYKNDFPLILNEVKCILGCNYVKYGIVYIKDEKYLAYENSNNISLKNHLDLDIIKSNYDINLIRNLFIINYILHVNINYNICIFNTNSCETDDILNFTSIKFHSVNEKNSKDIGNRIFNGIFKKYFDDSIELFERTEKSVLDKIEPEMLKQEMFKICIKYNKDRDKEYISWINKVYCTTKVNSRVYNFDYK